MINTTFKIAPWADVLYACDAAWWDVYAEETKSFAGERWSQDVEARKHGINIIQGAQEPGLGLDKVHFGGNSGYQAVNLAFLRGADKIVLLGYDMKMMDGKSHWHGDHPPKLNRGSPLKDWVPKFHSIAKDLKLEGVTVLNATRSTALNCFPIVDLEDALKCGSCLPALAQQM